MLYTNMTSPTVIIRGGCGKSGGGSSGCSGRVDTSAERAPCRLLLSGHTQVNALDKLPERPGDVKVRVHKNKELFLLLPPKVRDMKLIFLVPKKVRVRERYRRYRRYRHLLVPGKSSTTGLAF